jgi:hypothetical protein
MNLNEAVNILNSFKNQSLKDVLKGIEETKEVSNQHDFRKLFEAAQKVKKASAQVDEMVHSAGIMLVLQSWLKKNEVIEYLSLGAANHKNRFDLETNLRIAEFKFGIWNDSSANGSRRRGYFGNYVSLLTSTDKREKYFVVEDKKGFMKFIEKEAKWENVLSRNKTGYGKLSDFLNSKKQNDLKTVGEIFNKFDGEVRIISFDEIVLKHRA